MASNLWDTDLSSSFSSTRWATMGTPKTGMISQLEPTHIFSQLTLCDFFFTSFAFGKCQCSY